MQRKALNRILGTELRGRKVDPNSARQIRLAELDAKRANGELKRGRPSAISKLVDMVNNGELVNA